MHPAPSVILFTTISGLGFGLLAWLGLGYPEVTGWAAFGMYFVGYALAVGGLLSSVFHLANPKNAIKSFSQWRTSWLSREGVLAVLTLFAIAPEAIAKIFFATTIPALGWIGSALCLVTVYCTSMIYAQLRTVPRWNMPITPLLFLGYAVTGGALLAGEALVAAVLLAFMAAAQIVGWMMGDGRFKAAGSTLATATGLGTIGTPRQFEPPHSGRNYLLDEMGFRIGRKHAQKLKVIGVLLAFALPILVLVLAPVTLAMLALAAVIHVIGVLAVRWLFFAEAEHVVSLYYGKVAG